MAAQRPYVIGIDPGLKVTGYGVIANTGIQPVLVEGGVLQSDPSAFLEQRLLCLLYTSDAADE